MRRRRLLLFVGSAFPTFGGCSLGANGSDEGTSRFSTPGESECNPIDLPTPEPTDDAAAEYAVRFEEAYRFNRFLTTYRDAGYTSLAVSGEHPVVTTEGDGVAVGVNVTLEFGGATTSSAEETAAPSGRGTRSAWYYVTGAFALRDEHHPDSTIADEMTPGLGDPETVACTSRH